MKNYVKKKFYIQSNEITNNSIENIGEEMQDLEGNLDTLICES